jgi:cytochrome d ubiquinol oxidase subunit I
LGSLFVLTISCWYLLKGRHVEMAKKSIVVASVFGLLSSLFVAFTGDEAAFEVAQKQPMKLAAFEGLYKGETNAGLVAVGMINGDKKPGDGQQPFLFEMKVPGALSLLANRKTGSFVPGIDDLVYGNKEHNVMGVVEKMSKGKLAVADLAAFKQARKAKDVVAAQTALTRFNTNKEFLGYGYLNTPEEAAPPISTAFYSFHIMVILGSIFPVLFLAFLFLTIKGKITEQRWLLPLGVLSFFLGHIAQQMGWVVAEVGRQPWAIQGLMPVKVATTNIAVGHVQATFFMFLAVFTLLLIAEIKIMLKQISIGPEGM